MALAICYPFCVRVILHLGSVGTSRSIWLNLSLMTTTPMIYGHALGISDPIQTCSSHDHFRQSVTLISPALYLTTGEAKASMIRKRFGLRSGTRLSVFAFAPLRHTKPRISQYQRRSASQLQEPLRIRPLVPPPSENAGPLLMRLPNRALPSIERSYTWLKTLPIFIGLITISALAIFNYQKSSSSTVNSILYALRTNQTAREVLGDEIYFARKVPWIRGEMNQLHGRINISFKVKGRKATGKVKFVSTRRRRNGLVSAQLQGWVWNGLLILRSSKPWNGVWKPRMERPYSCWMIAPILSRRSAEICRGLMALGVVPHKTRLSHHIYCSTRAPFYESD